MRIDTQNKVIYLANTKTGSTSLRAMVDKYANKYLMDKLRENNLFHNHWSLSKYLDCLEIFNKKYSRNINLNEYFSFTTIRNPWDRLVSAYKYQKCDVNGNPWYVEEFDKHTAYQYPFEEFVKRLDNNDYWCNNSTPNATNFCFDKNGKQLLTKIYPIETLTVDDLINDIYVHCGVKYDIQEMLHLNKTRQGDYRKYYNKQWMIDKVAEVYQKDIELGNYEF
jgi:hypothetical protein